MYDNTPIFSIKTQTCDLKLGDTLSTGKIIDQFEYLPKDWDIDECVLIWWDSLDSPIGKILSKEYFITYCSVK